ncbi:hypothetical protein IJ384_00470 [bacterium]|nr:hypothetical protein [bacterium]
MLLNPPSEQEIALKKQQEQAWIDSILNKAFPENPNTQTEQTLKTNNSSISPMGTSNQNSLEGFGQNSINGFTNKKKQNEFPDLGKSTDYKNGSFAPVYDEEEKEMRKNYFRDPNHNIVIDEIEGPFIEKKQKPKYEAEEPVDYEEMPDEDEDTTSEELETSEETDEGNSKEEPEETSSELQDEPYLRYEDLLPDETDEEREAREARELEAFNKAWDKANGVEEKDADGVLTGGAAGIEQSDIKKTGKNNLTWQENFLDNYLRNAELIKNSYPISSNMYTDARTDFSKARTDKNAKILDNMSSLDSKTQEVLKRYGVKPNERGVYYNTDSDVSKKFGKSRELKRAFDKNYQDIKDGKFKGDNLNFDATMIEAITNKDKFDRHSSIQHAKLIDAYIDEQGRKHGKIGDDYDFKKRADTLKNIPNNHGYSLQEKGALENFFTVMDVIIEDEEEKEKLLNKLMKKMQR